MRTEQGRAEVLLTPGVILRVREKSAIRMVANALSDTRVEFLAGSAIVESAEPAAGTSVTLIYKDWSIRQPQKGLYRIDCEPSRLQVRDGEAEVSATGGSEPVRVGQGMDLPFASVLVPDKSAGEVRDGLTDWAEGRAESISTDNSIAANIQDPASMTGSNLPADAFTYFPMLGYSLPSRRPVERVWSDHLGSTGIRPHTQADSIRFTCQAIPIGLCCYGCRRADYRGTRIRFIRRPASASPPLPRGTLTRPVTAPTPARPHFPMGRRVSADTVNFRTGA